MPAWPFELRADLMASLLDYAGTTDLMRAVKAGDAPTPTALRANGREPVWYLPAVEQFLAHRHAMHINGVKTQSYTVDDV